MGQQKRIAIRPAAVPMVTSTAAWKPRENEDILGSISMLNTPDFKELLGISRGY